MTGLFLNMSGFFLKTTDWIVLNMTGFLLTITGFVQNINGFLLIMTGYVRNKTGFDVNMAWFVPNVTRFVLNDRILKLNSSSLALIVNRLGVAGAVLQTASWLIHSFIQSLSDPFPPYLKKIVNSKPLKLGSWNCETMFTTPYVSHDTFHMSCVTYHVSPVTCHISQIRCKKSNLKKCSFFYVQSCGASQLRVCF